MKDIEGIKKLFKSYQSMGDKTFEQLSDSELFWQYNDASNSIAIIVKHLWGNMLSRWTEFLTTDGEKEWRNREAEFENDIKTRTELLEKWNEGWDCLYAALDSINNENKDTLVYIRNQGHTIEEAVSRQLAHYSSHVGQIVFIGKMKKSDDWISLSIPKGQSSDFNEKKFAQPKRREHFTDESNNKNS